MAAETERGRETEVAVSNGKGISSAAVRGRRERTHRGTKLHVSRHFVIMWKWYSWGRKAILWKTIESPSLVFLVNTGVQLFIEGKTQHSEAAAQWMRYERVLKSWICFPWRPFTVPKEIKCSWEISPGVVAGGTGGGERGVLWGTWRHGSPSIQFGSMTRVQWVPVRPPGQTRSEPATGQSTAEVRWGPRYPVGNPPPLR